MKLVFATHNQNKLKEVATLMPSYIELLSLTDIGCFDEIPLEVQELNNEPGVYSARYAGPANDAQANMDKLLANLNNKTNRSARFKTVIVFIQSEKIEFFTGICEGTITRDKKGTLGFGYDPIFQAIGFKKTFAEMTLAQKSEIGHRGKAVRLLTNYLSKA